MRVGQHIVMHRCHPMLLLLRRKSLLAKTGPQTRCAATDAPPDQFYYEGPGSACTRWEKARRSEAEQRLPSATRPEAAPPSKLPSHGRPDPAPWFFECVESHCSHLSIAWTFATADQVSSVTRDDWPTSRFMPKQLDARCPGLIAVRQA